MIAQRRDAVALVCCQRNAGPRAHGGRSTGTSVKEAPDADRRAVPCALTEVIAKLKPGGRLGTKNELRERVGVSIGTFNESLRILQSRGLIELRRGRRGGLFAAERSAIGGVEDAAQAQRRHQTARTLKIIAAGWLIACMDAPVIGR